MSISREEIERLHTIFEEGYAEPSFIQDLIRESQPDNGDIMQAMERAKDLTSTFFSDMANGPVLFPPMGLGLVGKVEISAVYVENHGSTASILVSGGSGGSQGVQYASVSKGTYRNIALPNGIHELSFETTGTDSGLVLVTLTTHKWKPTFGTII